MVDLSLTPVRLAAATTEHTHKVMRAAREFEAVLLNSLLGPLEKTFSSLPGGVEDATSDQYQSMGMQALSSSLAAGRGVGIADMICRSLLHTPPHDASLKEKTSQEVLPLRGSPNRSESSSLANA